MKKLLPLIFVMLIAFQHNVLASSGNSGGDTVSVIALNKQAFISRLSNPAVTVNNATQALTLAQKIRYKRGIAEAYRIRGIGYYYENQTQKAFENYSSALDYYTQLKDLHGQGKVDNNIGNLYRENDFDRALKYFQKSLTIAQTLNDKALLAPVYLNIGTINYRQKSFTRALAFYDKSYGLYTVLRDTQNMVQCLQNTGLVYYNLDQYDKAENFLTSANNDAKRADLNEPVASINLTLANIYLSENKLNKAGQTIKEGLDYARIINDQKMIADFKDANDRLEAKRKGHKKAV